MKTFQKPRLFGTYDNGPGPAFVVEVKPLEYHGETSTLTMWKGLFEVGVFLGEGEDETGNYETSILDKIPKPILARTVFIGDTPKVKERLYFWGVDGNSVLLQVGGDVYTHVGASIFTFRTESPITKYYSPIGNSSVPYPYAMCENGDAILMIDDVIVIGFDWSLWPKMSPYGVYYKHQKQEKPHKVILFESTHIAHNRDYRGY